MALKVLGILLAVLPFVPPVLTAWILRFRRNRNRTALFRSQAQKRRSYS